MWMSFIPKMTWCFPCFAEAGITYYQTLNKFHCTLFLKKCSTSKIMWKNLQQQQAV